MNIEQLRELVEREKASPKLIRKEQFPPFSSFMDEDPFSSLDILNILSNKEVDEAAYLIIEIRKLRFKKALRDFVQRAMFDEFAVTEKTALSKYFPALFQIRDLIRSGDIEITFKEESKYDSIERNSPRYQAWRGAVLLRDKFVCQNCKSRHDLQAHHIKSYADHPELACEVSNGITLCEGCHKMIHSVFGVSPTEENLREFVGVNA